MSTIGATDVAQASFHQQRTKTTLEPLGHGGKHTENLHSLAKFILSFLHFSILSYRTAALDVAWTMLLSSRYVVPSATVIEEFTFHCTVVVVVVAVAGTRCHGELVLLLRWSPLSAQRWKEARMTGDRAMRYERKLGVNKVRFSAV